MVEKTKGVVLNYTKYSDSSGIVNMYTPDYGRQAYLVRGVSRGKKGPGSVLFQPLTILEIVATHRQSREIQNMRSCSLAYIPSTIPYNITKSTMAIFIAEVLNASIREVTPDAGMYHFLEESIILLDRYDNNVSSFHLSFMMKLAVRLGFGPLLPDGDEPLLFDMTNGVFSIVPPADGLYMNHEQSDIMRLLISTPLEDAGNIIPDTKQRRLMLDMLAKYYSIHIPGFKNLKSLKVLQEVFG